jgi:WD40 repeat protein
MQLLSGGTDKTVRLWDVRSGGEVRSYPGEFAQGIYQAAFSRDGNRMAVASWELSAGNKLPVIGFIKILDVKTGALIRRFDTDDHPAASAIFTPDDSSLISGTWGFHIKRHDLAEGKTLWDYDLSKLPYYAAVQWVDVSPDGNLVLQCGKDRRIRLLDAGTGSVRAQIDPWTGHTQWVNCVRFSPDGRRFASAGDDGIVKVWRTETAEEEYTLRGHLGAIQQLVWSRDGAAIWSAGADSTVREWVLDTPGERTFPAATTGLWAAPVHPGGELLAAASFERGAVLWNLDSGTQIRRLDSIDALTVTFVRDAALAAVGTSEGKVNCYDVRTGAKRFGVEGHAGRVNAVAYNPGLDRIASVGGRAVCLWDPDSSAPVMTITTASTPMTVSFTPDGRSLLAGCRDGWVRVFELPGGTPADSFRSGSTVGSQAISPDGRYLVTGGDGGTCYLWDIPERRLVRRLEGHTKWVYGLAFHPSKPFLVTASYDQTVKVWDLERLEPAVTLYGFPEAMYTASLARGGDRLVLTEVTGKIHVLDIPRGQETP